MCGHVTADLPSPRRGTSLPGGAAVFLGGTIPGTPGGSASCLQDAAIRLAYADPESDLSAPELSVHSQPHDLALYAVTPGTIGSSEQEARGATNAPQECVSNPDVGLVLIEPDALPLGGIRCWEETVLRLVATKAHPKVTVKTTAPLARALASYADWTTGADIRPTWKRLAADIGCSRRSIAYHLKWLQEMGVLELLESGTRLPGGMTLASVYKAQIPNTALARRAKERAAEARREAGRTRTTRTIGARHVTCSAAAARSTRTRAAARSMNRCAVRAPARPHDRRGFCTPPGVDLTSEALLTYWVSPDLAENQSAATASAASDLAQWLVSTVVQFRSVPVRLAEALLRPLSVAGWTRDDLAYWLGLKTLPAWYIEHTTGHRSLDPWPLPAAVNVRRPFGLLAHRCSGVIWRGFELPSVVRRRAHETSLARAEQIMTEADRRLSEEVIADVARARSRATLLPATGTSERPEAGRPRIGGEPWEATLVSSAHGRNLARQAALVAKYTNSQT